MAIRHIRHYNKLIDSIYADSDDKRLFGITTLLLLTVITGILSFTVNAVGRFVFLNSTVTLAALACFFCFLLYLICYRGFVQQFSFVDIENEERKDSIEDIKTRFAAAGWNCTVDAEIYETDTGLYHIAMTAVGVGGIYG